MLAARLSEDPDRDVVLLESGPDLSAGSVPPEIDGVNFLATADLSDRQDPDMTATRVTGGLSTPYRRGRGVGGSSAINAMVALRGDATLYRSWGWDDVEEAWAAVAVPEREPDDDELGAVDRALLAAAADARRAPLTRREGRRVTSAEAYLWPASARPNLTIRHSTTVDRVALDGRRAVGVVLSNGEEIDAERVIVSAGAIRTPALLLRSGLDTPGIGAGLQDHPSVPFTLALRPGVPVDLDGLVIGAYRQRAGIQFLSMNHVGRGSVGFGVLLVALMTPRGRSGSVRLDPADPGGPPLVDFALLAEPADVHALTAGIGDAVDLVRSGPFADIVEEIYVDDVGTTLDAFTDEEAIQRWLPRAVGDYVHASSSCAMGTVVGADGAVGGYEGVYVCDASVFPTIPDVNTHLPTTMLAERLSARWRRGRS